MSSRPSGSKRLFTITDVGEACLHENRGEFERIKAQIDAAAAPIGESAMGEAIPALRSTLFEKMRQGSFTKAQSQKVREVLQKAREDVEKL